MQNLWNTVSNVVLDLKASQAITLVIVALFLSVATAGLFRLLSRGKTDVTAALAGLVLVASLISMLTAESYLRYGLLRERESRRNPAAIEFQASQNIKHVVATEMANNLAGRVLMEYDTNGDGQLSADEAAAGTSQFMAEAGSSGNHPGSVNIEDLRSALRGRFFMTPMPPGPR
jgi:hypothetical protein